jgi:hypothetical protein
VIIHALKKWRTDLLGAHVDVYTDHRTLQNFVTQHDLSCCQARWAEYMLQYDLQIHYIKGKDNLAADALQAHARLILYPQLICALQC